MGRAKYWIYIKKIKTLVSDNSMKKLFFITLIFFIAISAMFSCREKTKQNKPNWTENQKRKYFNDSIAFRYCNGLRMNHYHERSTNDIVLNNFAFFMDSLYPEIKAINKQLPFIYAFEEPYIDNSKIDSSKNWIRMILDPCWRIPCCITIEKKNDRTYLTSKITNGLGGYYSGLLLSSFTKVYSDTLYDHISKELHKTNFWKIRFENFDCCDGETWYFEAIEKGKYNYVMRRCLRRNEKNATRADLYKIGIKLLTLGNFFDENYVESWPFYSANPFLKLVVDTTAFKVKMIGNY